MIVIRVDIDNGNRLNTLRTRTMPPNGTNDEQNDAAVKRECARHACTRTRVVRDVLTLSSPPRAGLIEISEILNTVSFPVCARRPLLLRATVCTG